MLIIDAQKENFFQSGTLFGFIQSGRCLRIGKSKRKSYSGFYNERGRRNPTTFKRT